jgi:hypothetical protein
MPAETPAIFPWKRFRRRFGIGVAVTPLALVAALISTHGSATPPTTTAGRSRMSRLPRWPPRSASWAPRSSGRAA